MIYRWYVAYTLINNPSLIKTRHHKKEEKVVKKTMFPTHLLPHFMYKSKSQVKTVVIEMNHSLSSVNRSLKDSSSESKEVNTNTDMNIVMIDDNIKMNSYKEEDKELNLVLSTETDS